MYVCMALFSWTWESFVNILFTSGPELALFSVRYHLMIICSASLAKATGYGYALQDSVNTKYVMEKSAENKYVLIGECEVRCLTTIRPLSWGKQEGW